jgi:hypothetical protein
MVASEILQMSSNALAIIRNPVVFPKSNFYDAYTSTKTASSWKALVNGKIGKVDFGERNLTDYLANQEVTASSGELQMREAMPSQAGKGWIGSKGRTSPSHTHEIEPTYTE